MIEKDLEYCQKRLKLVRETAHTMGVEVPKRMYCARWGITHKERKKITHESFYQVHAAEIGIVWQGNAFCAADAKASYIESLIVEYMKAKD